MAELCSEYIKVNQTFRANARPDDPDWVRHLKTSAPVDINPNRLGSVVLGLCVALILLMTPESAPALDLNREVEFHIAAQPLETALLQFSQQANTPVAVDARLLASLRTSGLHGKRLASIALAILLRDSGLTYTIVGNTVTVLPNVAPKPKPPVRQSVSAGRAQQHAKDAAVPRDP